MKRGVGTNFELRVHTFATRYVSLKKTQISNPWSSSTEGANGGLQSEDFQTFYTMLSLIKPILLLYYSPSSNYVTSFSPQDYLNNPMFDSLNHHRRYWPHERTITLRPLTSRSKNSGLRKMQMASPRNACKVLS